MRARQGLLPRLSLFLLFPTGRMFRLFFESLQLICYSLQWHYTSVSIDCRSFFWYLPDRSCKLRLPGKLYSAYRHRNPVRVRLSIPTRVPARIDFVEKVPGIFRSMHYESQNSHQIIFRPLLDF